MPLYFTLVIAAVYGLWWFTVNATAPSDINPWQSRLVVVTLITGLWALAKLVPVWQRRGQTLFTVAIWLVTAHSLYLCSINA